MKNDYVIRILIVAGSMDVGGIENQLMHLVRNADRSKYHFSFTSNLPNAHYREEIEKLGCGFIELPCYSRAHPLQYSRFMYHIMKKEQYDIVHSHELFHSGLTLFLAWVAGVPCRIAHAHNWHEGSAVHEKVTITRWVYRFAMRLLLRCFSTQFIACSSLAGAFLYGSGVRKKKNYHLVYNSVDTAQFLSNYDHVETGEYCEDGWINLIHVGRFTPVKNQLFLVSVAEIIKRSQRKIRILCVGPGNNPYENEVREQIKEKELSDHIVLLGVRTDIDVLMRKSKAFLLPSLYEGMPLVLIEAQSAGLPCVIADTFSHEVDFGLGLIAWLKPKADAQNWYETILQAVKKQKPSLVQVEKAVQDGGFDSKLFAERICDIYASDFASARRTRKDTL